MNRRENAVTFKGAPMTLVGDAISVGQSAPDFNLHYYEGGMQTLSLADLKGKPSLISVVPSLDTGVCAIQTQKFNEELSALGDQVNAVTVSLDLPFAQGRFCGEHNISMRTASDYQDRSFGTAWGLLIDELKLLTRAVFVLNAEGEVTFVDVCDEVTNEPDYASAMDALKAAIA